MTGTQVEYATWVPNSTNSYLLNVTTIFVNHAEISLADSLKVLPGDKPAKKKKRDLIIIVIKLASDWEI